MIVITGKNGYIGSILKSYLEKQGLEVRRADVRGEVDDNVFKDAECVIHTAGIVHNKKADSALYESVNTVLTKKLAEIAKNSGVKHFVFFSTMSVYGMSEGAVTKGTAPKPVNDYGKSKLAAEKLLFCMQTDDFKITVLRPPMVYGMGCPGNYALLSKLVKKVPVFPSVENKRSLLYIENLCECVTRVIKEEITGIVCPQNKKYVNTAEMCAYIAKTNGKKIFLSKFLGKIIPFIKINAAKKAFGSLYYDTDAAFLCDFVGLEESIELTENNMLKFEQ
ncbi:MAG: NAD-dependent epimerase/dehydratase family protein [Firmicutes bacterium]|nr:NAD-dependent epimerase/dehydratase family protein [Bacillota bacterium]